MKMKAGIKKKLTKKEKWEVGTILGAVFLVAIVGLGMHFMQERKFEAIAGAAVRLNPEIPTYPGILILLKDYCGPVSGTGNCNSICETEGKICVPIEKDCSKSIGDKKCLCCSLP